MNKIVASVLITCLISGAVVTGIIVMDKNGNGSGNGSQAQLAELSILKENIKENTQKLDALMQSVKELASTQRLAAQAQSFQIKDLAEASANAKEGETTQDLATPNLKAFMLACLDEHERLKEEEQRLAREERQQQMEERRKQLEEFRKGPYDRYNLKINSMASALEMDDVQKTKYYELVKKYSDQFQESMKTLREQREAENTRNEGNEEGGSSRDRRSRRGGFDREAFQEITQNLQKEFSEEMGNLLTVGQMEEYNELSDQAKSFMNTGSATDSGTRGMRTFFGGGTNMMGGGRRTGGGGGRR